ncbi:MAG: QcrA and Rieske domain-containing protein [Planctomycetota bacterium]|jgi:Rieske Fe-S protein
MNTNAESNSTRRTFCKYCIGGMTAGSAAMVATPAATVFVGVPHRIVTDKPLVVSLEQLSEGQAVYGEHIGQQVIVLGRDEGPIVVSAACPHLGCNVTWEPADSLFRCPCHGATFDADGEILSGPVSSPLKVLPHEVKEGLLVVT